MDTARRVLDALLVALVVAFVIVSAWNIRHLYLLSRPFTGAD